jgi:hypothetical protein
VRYPAVHHSIIGSLIIADEAYKLPKLSSDIKPGDVDHWLLTAGQEGFIRVARFLDQNKNDTSLFRCISLLTVHREIDYIGLFWEDSPGIFHNECESMLAIRTIPAGRFLQSK